VLCADKTGTLTANELGVQAVRPVADGYAEADVLSLAVLASSPAGQDPIDTAIREAAQETPVRRGSFEVVRFTPFDPVAKMAEALVRDQGGRQLRIVKGARAALAPIAAMPPRGADELQGLAAAGFRTLAVACGPPGDLAVVGLIALAIRRGRIRPLC
jgi:H+-transporting ATPase